jgi:hypothetical protein
LTIGPARSYRWYHIALSSGTPVTGQDRIYVVEGFVPPPPIQ